VAAFEQVSKVYRSWFSRQAAVTALHEVSFTLQAGEVFGLLGPNRAGKTTLVKILLTLCRPTSGSVHRFGAPIDDRRTLARVGFMHENQAFPRYLTAAGLLEYYGALTLVPRNELRGRIPGLLKRVELADRACEPISRFSKGMVQRLALAQALINDPDLLVLDEPSEGLDLSGRQLIREIVQEQRQRGKSALLVSHVLPEAERLCDRVAVLVQGRLVHLGPMAELLHDTRSGNPRPLEQALKELYRKPTP
jgi:ABC-2 type transport system ATP-binding protein